MENQDKKEKIVLELTKRERDTLTHLIYLGCLKLGSEFVDDKVSKKDIEFGNLKKIIQLGSEAIKRIQANTPFDEEVILKMIMLDAKMRGLI